MVSAYSQPGKLCTDDLNWAKFSPLDFHGDTLNSTHIILVNHISQSFKQGIEEMALMLNSSKVYTSRAIALKYINI